MTGLHVKYYKTNRIVAANHVGLRKTSFTVIYSYSFTDTTNHRTEMEGTGAYGGIIYIP